MQIRHFEDALQMQSAAVQLLHQYFGDESETPSAIMLSGGKTPLAIYNAIRDQPIRVSPNRYVTFSDERMVPEDSAESNYANARPMLEALSISQERIIRVHPDLPLNEAAKRFNADLDSFLKRGKIALGLLGIGPDGHTASLFTLADANHLHGRFAIAVPKETKPDRVSVTPDLLRRIERILFLAVGQDKKEIIKRLIEKPLEIPAGAAVSGNRNVELWYA